MQLRNLPSPTKFSVPSIPLMERIDRIQLERDKTGIVWSNSRPGRELNSAHGFKDDYEEMEMRNSLGSMDSASQTSWNFSIADGHRRIRGEMLH
jgi:hypothetical protein